MTEKLAISTVVRLCGRIPSHARWPLPTNGRLPFLRGILLISPCALSGVRWAITHRRWQQAEAALFFFISVTNRSMLHLWQASPHTVMNMVLFLLRPLLCKDTRALMARFALLCTVSCQGCRPWLELGVM